MSVPKIVGVKPVGSQVLVEHLTENEMLNTSLSLPGKPAKKDVQQSYVLDYGPGFDPKSWGFDKGDRVIVVGTYNPVPVIEGRDRELGIVEPHNIRAKLIEEKNAGCCGCCSL